MSDTEYKIDAVFIRIVPKSQMILDKMVVWLTENDIIFHLGIPIYDPLSLKTDDSYIQSIIFPEPNDINLTAFYIRWGHLIQ